MTVKWCFMISSLHEFFFFGYCPLPTLELTEIAHLCASTLINPHTQKRPHTHTHTCSHINKCPSAISKKGHLEPIIIVSKRVCLVVTEPVCLLHGIISASSACICNDPTGQKPVCGWRGCKHEWGGVTQMRTEAACVLAAKGLVLQSLPYPRSASAWNWNVFLLKF